MFPRTRSGIARILLLEDNLGDVVILQEAFEDAGVNCQINVVANGEAGLAHLQQQAKRGLDALPDLILLDLNLPKLNGHEVLKSLKADLQLRCIPVLILSSSQMPRDIEQSYELHASAYLCKPMGIDEYVELARMIDSFWLRTVRLPTGVLSN